VNRRRRIPAGVLIPTPPFELKHCLLWLLLLMRLPATAATYWVAPDGNDANTGTASNVPFATPHKAVTVALAPGDTIWIRGGTYQFNARIAPGSSRVGAAGNPIKLWAYPGERPVFDFASMPESSDKALDLRRNYWHVRGLEIKNAPDSGIFVGGLGIVVEGCVVHDCDNDGIILGSTSVRATNALILNCDSYRNYQAGSGGNNGDGFGAKAGCGPGNVFRGCRAWDNADDGWDFYDNTNSVILEGCWAFRSGFDLWGVGGGWSGNGNGFKLGGEGTPAEHFLTNCVAFGNRSKGFDHNNGDAGQAMVNCTSYNNGAANFSFYETPSKGTLLRNVLINNASLGAVVTNLAPNTLQISNSWQVATVTAADFASLEVATATNARNADFSLPMQTLFRLAPGSDLIDRGRDVGLPFSGNAPDLGAFEFTNPPASAPVLTNMLRLNTNLQCRVTGLTPTATTVMQASTNLIHWQPVLTNPAGVTSFVFTEAINLPQRYYRAEAR
jgi:hypothetical protein